MSLAPERKSVAVFEADPAGTDIVPPENVADAAADPLAASPPAYGMRTLEELAADLRAMSDQAVAAHITGLDGRAGWSATADQEATPALNRIGQILSDVIGKKLEQTGARQREELASLMLHHIKGLKSSADRLDKAVRRMDAEWERDDALAKELVDRLDTIGSQISMLAVRQERTEELLFRRRSESGARWRLTSGWVIASMLVLAAICIGIGYLAAIYLGPSV
jgi:hypothetical protein